VCPYRRGAHTASRCQSNRQFGHRIAVWHFEHENDIVLTSRHIAADEPTAQSRDLALEGLVSSWYAFDPFRALVGPIQKADEEHGSPPFFQFTNGRGENDAQPFNASDQQHGEDNTMQCAVHAEPATDSEAQEFSKRLIASRQKPWDRVINAGQPEKALVHS
jgi:hypothetical protein